MFGSMTTLGVDAYAEPQPKSAVMKSAKDPRSSAPSSKYPAQRKEQETFAAEEKKSLRVCSLARSQSCNIVFEDDMRRCNSEENICQTSGDNKEDLSCVRQRCELEKAHCLLDVTTQYKNCLAAVRPVKPQEKQEK
jgi:hypothetical protein